MRPMLSKKLSVIIGIPETDLPFVAYNDDV
jgi:hypothetical protein